MGQGEAEGGTPGAPLGGPRTVTCGRAQRSPPERAPGPMGLSVRLEMSARWARCLFVYLGRGRWMRAFREMTKCLCLSQGGWPVLRPGRKGAKRRPLSRSSWPSAQEPGSEGSARSERGGAYAAAAPSARVSRGAGQGAPGAPLIPVAAASPAGG